MLAALPGQRGDARVGVPPHLGGGDLAVHPAPRPRHLAGRASTPRCTTTSCEVYASPIGRVLETLLGAALLYHALNGLRIVDHGLLARDDPLPQAAVVR